MVVGEHYALPLGRLIWQVLSAQKCAAKPRLVVVVWAPQKDVPLRLVPAVMAVLVEHVMW